ncbi:hypothetical protein LMG33818_001013 [Halomonadaceae bacterium LMG 33818]|uniref:gamma-butyrobetaine hydroxylase-like domain-containing protein n=1 Tax=Cernens ardua TaxID=3402176 RepID=UPI003EDB8DAB
MKTDDPRERFDTQTTPPAPVPIHVHYHQKKKEVELVYARTDIPASDSPANNDVSADSTSTTDRSQPHVHEASDDHEVGYRVSVELLRVFSPSAEVRGHSPDQAVLQTGKKEVGLLDIQAVGNYALKFVFDDGHNSGLYSWAYLYELARHRSVWWTHYLKELENAGASREGASILIKQL